MPFIPQNAARGAIPAQGNPMVRQTPKLSPQQMAALRQDPDIAKAIALYIGKPVPLTSVPDNLLMEIAGMVHKLGVQGAVAEFSKRIPPQVQAQIKARVGGSGPQTNSQVPPQGMRQ
jgi:hypothetical protein